MEKEFQDRRASNTEIHRVLDNAQVPECNRQDIWCYDRALARVEELVKERDRAKVEQARLDLRFVNQAAYGQAMQAVLDKAEAQVQTLVAQVQADASRVVEPPASCSAEDLDQILQQNNALAVRVEELQESEAKIEAERVEWKSRAECYSHDKAIALTQLQQLVNENSALIKAHEEGVELRRRSEQGESERASMSAQLSKLAEEKAQLQKELINVKAAQVCRSPALDPRQKASLASALKRDLTSLGVKTPGKQ